MRKYYKTTNKSIKVNRSQTIVNDNIKIISAHLTGGLGNRLFQIAAAYGIARKNNIKPVITSETSNYHSKIDYHLNIFRKVNFDLNIKIPNVYREPPHEVLMYNKNIPVNKSILLNGYFQNEKYFIDIKDEIIDLFSPDESFIENLTKEYNHVDNAFFIHIRRGDYLTSSLHNINLNEYNKKSIDYIRTTYPEAYIYVLSNDIKYCTTIDYLSFDKVIFVNDTNELNNLYLMSLCKLGGICCNSSFSWWGSYLNKNKDKEVFFPSRWFNSNWPEEIGYTNTKTLNI
jgi:hypothetical protein